MVRKLCKETKAEVFCSSEKKRGLGINHLGGKIEGKRERGRPRKQWKRDIRDAFDRSKTKARRWALDRSRFRCVVEDATSIRISS